MRIIQYNRVLGAIWLYHQVRDVPYGKERTAVIRRLTATLFGDVPR